MNLTNSFLAGIWLGFSVAAGAESNSRSQPSAVGRALGLWQTNGVLFKESRPYRGVGANYFDLFLRVLHDPTNRTSINGLGQLGRAGIPFVRFAVAYDQADWKIYFDQPEEFSRRLDLVVQASQRANVGLIPSFFWSFMSFSDLAREPCDQWGNPDSKTSAMMGQVVRSIVERYKHSSALWAWEFGNEPNLMADLPNAAQGRKPGGTERDDLTSQVMVIMLREFAKEVRRHDAHRLIIAGHSHPRASAWHNSTEKGWSADSKEQTLAILRRDNPAPLDTIAIHAYADQPVSKEMAAYALPDLRGLLAIPGVFPGWAVDGLHLGWQSSYGARVIPAQHRGVILPFTVSAWFFVIRRRLFSKSASRSLATDRTSVFKLRKLRRFNLPPALSSA